MCWSSVSCRILIRILEQLTIGYVAGSTNWPSIPNRMTDIRQVMMPESMIVLQTGCESWITLKWHKTERKKTWELRIDFFQCCNATVHILQAFPIFRITICQDFLDRMQNECSKKKTVQRAQHACRTSVRISLHKKKFKLFQSWRKKMKDGNSTNNNRTMRLHWQGVIFDKCGKIDGEKWGNGKIYFDWKTFGFIIIFPAIL